jgi:hypothetical protein
MISVIYSTNIYNTAPFPFCLPFDVLYFSPCSKSHASKNCLSWALRNANEQFHQFLPEPSASAMPFTRRRLLAVG